jgi:hypothetical protein
MIFYFTEKWFDLKSVKDFLLTSYLLAEGGEMIDTLLTL